MISDILFNAIQEIRRYQKELPLIYDEIKDELDRITKMMETLQLKLDDPNYTGPRYQPKRCLRILKREEVDENKKEKIFQIYKRCT